MAGQIPLIESQEDVRVGGIDVYSNPDQFGAGIGRELRGLGQTVASFAADLKAKKKAEEARGREERLAVNSAAAEIELGRISTEQQLTAPADGSGVMDKTLQEQQRLIDETVNKIEDPIERTALKVELTKRLAPYALNNLKFETDRNLKNQEDITNFTLNGIENRVRNDASSYDVSLADGIKIIDAQKVPIAQKEEMKRNWTQRAANSRFQGLLADADSLEDFDAIAHDLTDKNNKWLKAFTPQEFASTLKDIDSAKKAFATLADEQARAAVTSAEARTQDLVRIDPAELTLMQQMAETSKNPVTLKRVMRVRRDQQILEKSSKLPATEKAARAAELKNGGYPGMPDELNIAMQKTQTVFPDVSTSFLGGVVVHEYGKYLPKGGARKGSAKFTPVPVGANVDTRLMKPAAYNATVLAGEIYGAPLQLVSGHRSQTRQDMLRFAAGKDPNRKSIAKKSHHTAGDAIDVSTVGKSGAEKAKLVDALLQAGFTGIGEYDTHIHADMRSTTPGTFNAETGQLGWTKGSPEVIQAMLARGYSAGLSGDKLARGNAARSAEKVDYGRSADGGKTSATGISQSVDTTWLGIMRDPNIAQRIGLPPNLTDDQLLELRKDPTVSMMAIGAYAEQNQKILTNTLGRPATDPELLMAHFLGPTGAQQLISAAKNSPNAIAAEAMPKAAANNPPRFYENAGTSGKFVKGKPLTFKEVYDNIAIAMETAPNQVQYEDAKAYERMAEASKKAEAEDPMTQYKNSVAPINDLNAEGGYSARGATASTVAGLYSIPIEEMKPFTVEEAADLMKRMSEGTADQKLEIMRDIESMDQATPGLGKAAYAQLGQKDTAVAHAAALANERGDAATAEQIVRGQERLTQDKQLEATLFGNAQDVNTAFNTATEGSLLGLAPSERNAIFEASKALYAEKYARLLTFDPERFKAAVIQTVGGETEMPGMSEVNGKMTIIPPGVTGEQFNDAINSLMNSDLPDVSADGNPPINIEGDPISAEAIAREGEFVFIGGEGYIIRMNDGNTLVTGERLSNGTLRAFVFAVTPEELRKLATRPRASPEGLSTWEAPAGAVKDVPAAAAADGAAPVQDFMSVPGATGIGTQ